ncbi:DUF305 domain-containing protein [Sinimarinibacterium sp. CAU 1509]|uniref:DUF305 domain-containing protein n=1 Tax=Sinimarinibacterium sp. CAU 1509 TaxID=2562283 RepID=UPI0010AD3DB5|nr:DUF305 domain-containing protein [Sinimarinibacterium sp. CAU 1509]TJY63229.1 DUF305 domain-containing protein [Sinimarinibacterium sp. CAU 1509]
MRSIVLGIAVLAGLTAAFALGQRLGQARTATATAEAGPVEIGFAQFMSLHHDQAVVMAQTLLNSGTTRLGGLASSIASAQLLEIGQMRGWLGLWGKPLLPATREMDWMLLGKVPPDAALSRYLLDCQSAPGGMPGLASSEELNQLRALDGDARDALFLQLMIRHHQGGLPMAHFASLNTDIPAVRTLAAQITVQQIEELNTMLLLLRGWADKTG